MKFGVYIRSTGERTEHLCIDACKQQVDGKDIHVLRNYFPSYNVYKEMFTRAKKSNYDWFLGVDADVVLLPNWYDLISKKISSLNPEKTFKFTFRVYDPIYNKLIDRGNHIYNNTFTPFAIKALNENIFISKLPNFLKSFYNKGHYLKPETALRGMLLKSQGLSNFNYQEVIGIHGAEQYFSEIFRTFYVRSKRNPDLIKNHSFLQKKNQKKQSQQQNLDKYVANLGWHYKTTQKIGNVDARKIKEYQEILKNKYKVKERNNLEKGLKEFYDQYIYKFKTTR